MIKYLLDTTFLVEHLRGSDKTSQFLEKEGLCVSTVTIAELIQGARDKKELALVNKICKNIDEVIIDKKISKKAIDLLYNLHLSDGLMFLDALIAATAIENKLTLITGNIKHFNKIEELQVSSQEAVLKS